MWKFLTAFTLFLSYQAFAETGPYYCSRNCECTNYEGETTSTGINVEFRTDNHAWGNSEHNRRCSSACKEYRGASFAHGGTSGINPCYWDASKLCSVAHRSSKGTWTYWFWSNDRDSSYTALCDKGARELSNASNGAKPTVVRQTWFLPNTMTNVVAFCDNGTYRATGKGVEAFRNVNEKRKKAGGKGCIFDRDK